MDISNIYDNKRNGILRSIYVWRIVFGIVAIVGIICLCFSNRKIRIARLKIWLFIR